MSQVLADAALRDPQRTSDPRGPAVEAPETAEPQTFLTFSLGGQFFALSVAPVREILDEQPVAILPEAPSDVVGLIDVRGEGVPVIDVSRRLGVIATADRDRRIVVLEQTGGDGRPVGVFADQVLSVVEIANGGIEAAPRGSAASGGAPLLRGVARIGGHLVMVLDHRRLLGNPSDDLFDFGQ